MSTKAQPLDWKEWQNPPVELYSPNPKDLIGEKKVPLGLVPGPFIAVLAMVMKLGARKYGPYNWRKSPVKLTVYLNAALRHIYTALDGEWIDQESGQPHLAHAAACCAIVIDAWLMGTLLWDLPTPGTMGGTLAERMEKTDARR